ncbi:Rieske 2Fe-2S domain-containing protein [Rhodobacterales bacterium HKCCE2091]|nr:Rieske 2Fe-2S domain-containing protein [Rhodobacterales bacterium HKCCE2091]
MTDGAGALTRLCDLDELEEDEPLRSEVEGIGYAVYKVGELVFVTADLCTHGPGCLSDGLVDGFEVECPFHGGTFDIRTGAATSAPCEIPVSAWSPVIRDGAVFIDIANPLNA